MFWFGLDKSQNKSLDKTALSLPLLSWTGEREYDERLETRTGRDHSPMPSWAKQAERGEKIEFNSSPIKSE